MVLDDIYEVDEPKLNSNGDVVGEGLRLPGRATNVLTERRKHFSSINDDGLTKFRKWYGVPSFGLTFPALRDEGADYFIPGEVCLYEAPFRFGLRLPIPPFIKEVLSFYGYAPGQLMPNSWRILLGVLVLSETRNIKVSPQTIHYAYFPKLQNGRLQLHVRSGRHLVLTNEKESKRCKWKEGFFLCRI